MSSPVSSRVFDVPWRLEKLRDRLAAWVGQHVEALSEAEPKMPVTDRAADTWEPLIAIADAAGGHWPESARAACSALVAAADEADDERSLSTRLLTDIRTIFTDQAVPFLASADLVAQLRHLEESPWNDQGRELTARKLAYRLRQFGVLPGRAERNTVRGYWIHDLSDAFARYLSGHPSNASNASTTASDQQESVDTSERVDGSIRPHETIPSTRNRRSDHI